MTRDIFIQLSQIILIDLIDAKIRLDFMNSNSINILLIKYFFAMNRVSLVISTELARLPRSQKK